MTQLALRANLHEKKELRIAVDCHLSYYRNTTINLLPATCTAHTQCAPSNTQGPRGASPTPSQRSTMGARKREKAQEKKANTRKKQADYERRRDAYNAKRRQAGMSVLRGLHRIFLVILAVGLMMRFARFKLENNEKLTRTTSNETLVEIRRDVFGVAVRASLDTCAVGGSFTTKGLTEARSKLKCLWPLMSRRDVNATYFVLRRRRCEAWRLAVFRPVVGQAYAAHSIDIWSGRP